MTYPYVAYAQSNEPQLVSLFVIVAKVLNLNISPGVSHDLFQQINRQAEFQNLGNGNYVHVFRGCNGVTVKVFLSIYDPTPFLSVEISRGELRTEARYLFQKEGMEVITKFKNSKWLNDCADKAVQHTVSTIKGLRSQGWKKMEIQPSNQAPRFCSA